MNRRILGASMALALSFCATQAVMASPLAVRVPMNAKFGKIKTVSFTLRNDSSSTLKVMAGTNALTIEPGKTADTKVAIGDKIVRQDTAGTVIAVATSELSGTTLAIR